MKRKFSAPADSWREKVAACFERAGAVPAERQELLTNALMPGDNLLPLLVSLWDSEPAYERGQGWPVWLRRKQAEGAALTLGIPGPMEYQIRDWLGVRLAWWPQGVPAGRRVGIASSRLGRKLDARQAWFGMLRAACAKLDAETDILLTAVDTTSERFVLRAAELFDLRLLCIETPTSDNVSLDSWLGSLPTRGIEGFSNSRSLVQLSGQLEPTNPVAGSVKDVPDRDRALVAMSQQVLVFHVRNKGHMMKLLQRRLTDGDWPAVSVHVALGDSLIDKSSAAELMDAGAVGWFVSQDVQGATVDTSTSTADEGQNEPVSSTARPERIEVPSAERWDFLTHCTRAIDGPWPDQSEEDYLDDLILNHSSSDHSALTALERIVRERKLIAVGVASRGGVPAVSFTAVPLGDLKNLRTFRPHRGRWDFEPYGICIRRQFLERQRTRAVFYGSRQMEAELPDELRPYFQLHQSVSRRTGNVIDWTVEQEWRTPGDVDLTMLGADDAIVFVPTDEEAERIAANCPWPVATVGS